MDGLTMVGVSHRRHPLPVLERAAVAPGRRPDVLRALCGAGLREAVVLSTCSRVEAYAVGEASALRSVLEAGAAGAGLCLPPDADVRSGGEVVEHLFRVATGLESRVVGEVDIQGQVRAALREARDEGTTGPVLDQLLPGALRCARQVHTGTALGTLGRSSASRAVSVGLGHLTDVRDPVVLVVGSGRMASTTVAHLKRLGHRPRVAARDEARALRLAGPGLAWPLTDLVDALREADLVVCATAAARDVITLAHVQAATHDRCLVLVDLSVPRNVDSRVGALPGVRLVDLEEMGGGVSDPALVAALTAGAAIARAASRRHTEGLAVRPLGPALAAVRRALERSCRDQLVEAAGPGDGARLDRAARAAAAARLHAPTMAFRAAVADGRGSALQELCEAVDVPYERWIASAGAALRP